MTLSAFNTLSPAETYAHFENCCGSRKWIESMTAKHPFVNTQQLFSEAAKVWFDECDQADWKEAFSFHPKIGQLKGDIKWATTRHLAEKEQEGISAASTDVISELEKANMDYEKKFGFIFIISASGKSASAMLQLLKERMINSIHEEVRIAMGEQHKITQLRLRKLIESSENVKSQLTTHVLDTSTGRPARNVIIRLKDFGENKWETFAQGLTDDDGRLNDLVALPILKPGNYKLIFNTGSYYKFQNIKTFYPEVEIQFSIDDDARYHVPLLINPFGYSTYRGS